MNTSPYLSQFRTATPYSQSNVTSNKALTTGVEQTHKSYKNIAVISPNTVAGSGLATEMVNAYKRGPNLRA
jgi:hypothetical protein